MLLKLLPNQTKINFLGLRKIAIAFSALLMVASLALFFVRGFNLGIDFAGGITVEIGLEEPADLAEIRSSLGGLGLGDVKVQEFGDPTDVLIRIERQPGDATAQQAAVERVQAVLGDTYDNVSYRQISFVGPVVSEELAEKGALAITLAVVAVLIYIWLRFEWQFGLGAVVALVHDVVLTIGFFALTGLEFNLSIIAAILTIVGYSLNDTVVVYDRVRENLRKFRKMEMIDLLNLSLNHTLSRTLMTSLTTLLALFALFFFGGEVIQGFTAAMIWGVVVGTYSSVFIASPMLLVLNVQREAFLQDEAIDKAP